jgi:hypothetical protein
LIFMDAAYSRSRFRRKALPGEAYADVESVVVGA